MTAHHAPRTGKAARTRERILEVALSLVRERGYDGATMRSIADAAGMSLGSTYYYFPSKEHLIQAYYAQSHAEHLVACEPILRQETRLEDRLAGILRAKFDTSRDHHPFAVALFKTAADPASPLSPFSSDSEPTRRESTELFAEAVRESSARVPPILVDELPTLLWLYQMGLILFWIHDRSPDQIRSYRLLEHTCKIVCRLIRLASLAPLRPLVRQTAALLREMRSFEPLPQAPGETT